MFGDRRLARNIGSIVARGTIPAGGTPLEKGQEGDKDAPHVRGLIAATRPDKGEYLWTEVCKF